MDHAVPAGQGMCAYFPPEDGGALPGNPLDERLAPAGDTEDFCRIVRSKLAGVKCKLGGCATTAPGPHLAEAGNGGVG